MKQAIKLAPALCGLALLVAVFAGWKSFDLTYQAWDLWWAGQTPVSAFMSGHPHSMRYLIYYPVFLLAETFRVSVDQTFGLVCTTIFLVLTYSMVMIEGQFSEPKRWRQVGYVLLFFALAALMNGRLLFAFCGLSLAILGFLWAWRDNWGTRSAVAIAVGMLLASVSSGTLTVVAAYAFVVGCYLVISRPKRGGWRTMLIFLAMLFLLFSSTLWIGLMKNVDYFGGGIQGFIGMLDHGIGRVFLKLGTVGIILSGLVVVAGLAASVYLLGAIKADYRLVLLAVIPAAIGGLFGISTLAVGLVPLLLLVRTDLFSRS